jgi:TonB family protein
MSGRHSFKVALVLLALTAVAVAAAQSGGPKAPSDAPPAVVSAVAPFFPPIAYAARAMGSVVVEVKIDDAGAVASAELVSGHPLLKKAALDAARRWRFAAGSGAEGARTARLTFLFDERKDKPEPQSVYNDLVTFIPPYTVEVRKATPIIQYSVQ